MSDVYSPENLALFLQYIADGKQAEAVLMLSKCEELASAKGDVTDHSGRTFTNITGLQLAMWMLDQHMWQALLPYIPPAAKALQLQQAQTGDWVYQYGEHATCTVLINCYKEYAAKYERSSITAINNYLVKNIGGTQRLLPIHVIQEYLYPKRGLVPCPTFKEAILPRNIPRQQLAEQLGLEYALVRYDTDCHNGGNIVYGGVCILPAILLEDARAIKYLYQIRTEQRQELIFAQVETSPTIISLSRVASRPHSMGEFCSSSESGLSLCFSQDEQAPPADLSDKLAATATTNVANLTLATSPLADVGAADMQRSSPSSVVAAVTGQGLLHSWHQSAQAGDFAIAAQATPIAQHADLFAALGLPAMPSNASSPAVVNREPMAAKVAKRCVIL